MASRTPIPAPSAPADTAPSSVLGGSDEDLLKTAVILQLLLQRAA